MARKRKTKRKHQRGGSVLGKRKTKQKKSKKRFDIQDLFARTGREWHWPGYQYMGPGTHLDKRLKRGDPGINRLDRLAKAHDIAYSKAGNNLKLKHLADKKMIEGIQKFGFWKQKPTERIVKNIMKAKLKLKI